MMIALRANENEVGIAIGRLIICGPNGIRSRRLRRPEAAVPPGQATKCDGLSYNVVLNRRQSLLRGVGKRQPPEPTELASDRL